MDNIIEKANEYHRDVEIRAKAHEMSAEHHRKRGERLGNATTIVSGLVGSAVFLTISTQLGIGQENFSWPAQGLPLVAAIFVCLLSIAAPILSALHERINDSNQAAIHRASSRDYSHLKRLLDQFLIDFSELSLSSKEASMEFKKISEGIDAVRPELTLTKHAIDRAKEELGL